MQHRLQSVTLLEATSTAQPLHLLAHWQRHELLDVGDDGAGAHHQSHERLCAHRRPRDHNALRLVWHAKLGRQQRSGLAVAAVKCILVRLNAKLRTCKALTLAGGTLPLSSEAEHTF